MGRIAQTQMEILVGHKLVEIKENSIVVEHAGGLKKLKPIPLSWLLALDPSPS